MRETKDKPYVITILGRLPSLNELIGANRANKQAGANMKRKVEHDISVQLPNVRFKSPVIITFRWFEPNKRRDLDNIRSGAKFCLDSMVRKGMLEDDGQRHVIGLRDEYYTDGKRPRIEIVVEEV